MLCLSKWAVVLIIVFVFLEAVEGNYKLCSVRVYVFLCNSIFPKCHTTLSTSAKDILWWHLGRG
jgi:hypothetical protein